MTGIISVASKPFPGASITAVCKSLNVTYEASNTSSSTGAYELTALKPLVEYDLPVECDVTVSSP